MARTQNIYQFEYFLMFSCKLLRAKLFCVVYSLFVLFYTFHGQDFSKEIGNLCDL